jgi:hypothetical protein
MEIPEILGKLERLTSPFPKEAVEAAVARTRRDHALPAANC